MRLVFKGAFPELTSTEQVECRSTNETFPIQEWALGRRRCSWNSFKRDSVCTKDHCRSSTLLIRTSPAKPRVSYLSIFLYISSPFWSLLSCAVVNVLHEFMSLHVYGLGVCVWNCLWNANFIAIGSLLLLAFASFPSEVFLTI